MASTKMQVSEAREARKSMREAMMNIKNTSNRKRERERDREHGQICAILSTCGRVHQSEQDGC